MQRVRFLAFALALAPALTFTALPVRAADQGKITVFAAASLREAFEAAAPAFTRQSGVAVTFNFGGSDTLVAQILQGAPADVFASANQAQMKRAIDAGAVNGSPAVFARNRIVIIVPKANPAKVTSAADLARPGVKVVLAASTVPVGAYARATFAKMSGQDGRPADFAAAIDKNVVSNELDVKAVAAKVALGEGDAGVVYATDVAPIADKVTVVNFPPGAAEDAAYPIAALKAAQNAAGARAFIAFMLGDGQQYLTARGFLKP